jgi:hypothetical protein
LWKSVAYNLSAAIASPLYTAPPAEESAPVIAVATFTVGDQPRICPASVANRKRALPLLPLWLTTKSVATALNTVPVGPPGTDTVRACFAPLPLYSVEVFVPLFDDHHGVVGPAERPQELTSDASAAGAAPVPSATRSCTENTSSWMPALAEPAASAATTAIPAIA